MGKIAIIEKNNLSQSFAHCIQYLIQQYIFLTLENLGKENYNEMKRRGVNTSRRP